MIKNNVGDDVENEVLVIDSKQQLCNVTLTSNSGNRFTVTFRYRSNVTRLLNREAGRLKGNKEQLF